MPGSASASGGPGSAQPGIGSRGNGSAGRAAVTSIAQYAGVQEVVRVIGLSDTPRQRIAHHTRRHRLPYFGRKYLEYQRGVRDFPGTIRALGVRLSTFAVERKLEG